MDSDAFFTRGWCRFPQDPAVMRWAEGLRPRARECVRDPANAQWLRCGGTWFAGVDAIGADEAAKHGFPPGAGITAFLRDALGWTIDETGPGQVSVCYPDYPQPMDGESDAAFNYRRTRDAAHVDGIHYIGEDRRRFLREHHAFLAGFPLSPTEGNASPLAVWEGSHEIVRTVLRERFGDIPVANWPDTDITDTYKALRRRIFAECHRVTISAQPGEAYVVHRLALHGISPWGEDADAGPDGRMILYFRPETGDPVGWLNAP